MCTVKARRAVLIASIATMTLAGKAVAELPELKPTQTLRPSPEEVAEAGSQTLFGYETAVSGDTALISLPAITTGFLPGSVAVFERNGGQVWRRAGTLQAPAGANEFGRIVELQGELAAIGGRDSVFIYGHFLDGWTQTARVELSSAAFGSHLSVHLDHGFLTVGAANALDVYELSQQDTVLHRTTITPPEPASAFGSTAAIAGRTLLVGAEYADDFHGAAYVYRREGQQWLLQQKLIAINGKPFDRFGAALAIVGKDILVGAPVMDPEGQGPLVNGPPTPDGHAAGGAVIVFSLENGVWSESARLRPSPEQLFSYGFFGHTIQARLGRTVIGAVKRDAGSIAVVYDRQGNARLATSFARGGQIQGGIELTRRELFLGSPYESTDDGEIGAVEVFDLGTASGELPTHPLVQIVNPSRSDLEPDLSGEPAFGGAVVIRNEQAFIGMPASGTVAVYSATPTALVRTGTLAASDPEPVAGFGRSLAFRDGVLVVGADKAAYVFQRSNGVWTQRQKMMAPAADDVGSFADALHYEAGTLTIGANTGARFGRPGAVYIYERSGAGKFIALGKVVSPDSSPNDDFGTAVSSAGRVMVVGASNTGAAYTFRRDSDGVWRQHQTLIASELAPGHGGFGAAVAIDRGMIIVGAPLGGGDDPTNPDLRSGAAYGFTLGTDNLYLETFKLKPRPDEFNEYYFFGRQIAMFNQRIVIGAQRIVSSDNGLNGVAAFTYTRAGSRVTARGVALHEFASTSLSLANQRLLVGAPCRDLGFCRGEAALYNLNVLE